MALARTAWERARHKQAVYLCTGHKALRFIFPRPHGLARTWHWLPSPPINVTTVTKQAFLKACLTVHSITYLNSWALSFFFFKRRSLSPSHLQLLIVWKSTYVNVCICCVVRGERLMGNFPQPLQEGKKFSAVIFPWGFFTCISYSTEIIS